MVKIKNSEISAVDDFLKGQKTLAENEPTWGKLMNGRWCAAWPIFDDLGAIKGSLNFRLDPKYPDYPTLSLIFQGRPVARIDLTPDHWVKPNPPWAFGCPSTVLGNHVHTWQDNKDRIAATGHWVLQARQPVPHAVKRVPHMLRWFAEHINLSLYAAQYSFDFSAKRDMFGEETTQ